jgi:hypothetical protein
MALPAEIGALLHKHSTSRAFEDHPCEGSKFHSPRPLQTHACRLPDKRIVYLCGTCRDNLGVYVFLSEAERGLDWPTQRLFGNQIRAIANRVLEVKRSHD